MFAERQRNDNPTIRQSDNRQILKRPTVTTSNDPEKKQNQGRGGGRERERDTLTHAGRVKCRREKRTPKIECETNRSMSSIQGQLLIRSSLNGPSGPSPMRLRELTLTTARLTPTALVYADSRGRAAGSVPLELVSFVEHLVDSVHAGCNPKHLGSCFTIRTVNEEVEAVAGSPAAAEEWCREILGACEALQAALSPRQAPAPPQTPTEGAGTRATSAWKRAAKASPRRTPREKTTKVTFADDNGASDAAAPAGTTSATTPSSSAKRAANLIAARVKSKVNADSSSSPHRPPPPPAVPLPEGASAMITRLANVGLTKSGTATASDTSTNGASRAATSSTSGATESTSTALTSIVVDLKTRVLTTRWRCAAAVARLSGELQRAQAELDSCRSLHRAASSELRSAYAERDILLEHSASLEVQIRTLIEEQAIREFHSQQERESEHEKRDAYAEILDALGSAQSKRERALSLANVGPVVEPHAVDEQELLFLRERYREASEEAAALRTEAAAREREDAMRVAMLGLSETVPVYFDEVTMAHAEGEVLLNGSMKVRVLARCIADEFGARGRVIEVCGVNLDTLNGDELVGFAIPRALYEAAGNRKVLVRPPHSSSVLASLW